MPALSPILFNSHNNSMKYLISLRLKLKNQGSALYLPKVKLPSGAEPETRPGLPACEARAIPLHPAHFS